MKGKFKRILYGTGAVVIAAALAVGGTFAYRNWERKSNPVQGMAKHQARLVEDYEKNPEWVKDKPIKKNVKVRNMGGVGQFTGDNWGDIYVGIQLLEYMDITPYNYTYITGEDTSLNTGSDPMRFMVDINGNFVRFSASGLNLAGLNAEDRRAAIAAAYQWDLVIPDLEDGTSQQAKRDAFIDGLVTRKWAIASGYYDKNAAGDPVDYYYLPTIAGDPNGQYGAYVVKEAKEDTSKRTLLAGTKRLTANGQGAATHEDYLEFYQPHLWGDHGDPRVHEYISVVLDREGSDWVLLSNFDETFDYGNGGVWILDDSADGNGWAYWSEPLPPKAYTDLLVKELLPLVAPEESIYYDLYVWMDAYSKDQVPSTWPIYEAPAKAFRAVGSTTAALSPGGSMTFKSYLGSGAEEEDVTAETEWTLHEDVPTDTFMFPMSIGTPDETTAGSKLTQAGKVVTLTISASETKDKLYVKAVYDGNVKVIPVAIQLTQQTTLNVNPNAPGGGPHIPAGSEDTAEDIWVNFYVYGFIPTDSRVVDLANSAVAGLSPHYGGIQLADILNGSTAGITVDYDALDDDRFNEDNLYPDELHGEPCIIWTYAPSQAELEAFKEDNPEAEYFYIDLLLPLTNGTLQGSVNVRMIYSSGCVYEWE